MEWKEITPEQDDWKKQINITAYYGEHVLGSIVLVIADEGWNSLIDGKLEYLEAETEEDAKNEMKIVLENHFESERNYYIELLDMLSDLN